MAEKFSLNDSVVSQKSQVVQKSSSNKILYILLCIITLIAIGAGVYAFTLTQNTKKSDYLSAEQKRLNDERAQGIVANLSKILYIEDKETPAVLSIEDSEKVKTTNAEFFKNAQKGDVMLIYKSRAILYREAESKIINIAPIIDPDAIKKAQQVSTQTTTTNSVKK